MIAVGIELSVRAGATSDSQSRASRWNYYLTSRSPAEVQGGG